MSILVVKEASAHNACRLRGWSLKALTLTWIAACMPYSPTVSAKLVSICSHSALVLLRLSVGPRSTMHCGHPLHLASSLVTAPSVPRGGAPECETSRLRASSMCSPFRSRPLSNTGLCRPCSFVGSLQAQNHNHTGRVFGTLPFNSMCGLH